MNEYHSFTVKAASVAAFLFITQALAFATPSVVTLFMAQETGVSEPSMDPLADIPGIQGYVIRLRDDLIGFSFGSGLIFHILFSATGLAACFRFVKRKYWAYAYLMGASMIWLTFLALILISSISFIAYTHHEMAIQGDRIPSAAALLVIFGIIAATIPPALIVIRFMKKARAMKGLDCFSKGW